MSAVVVIQSVTLLILQVLIRNNVLCNFISTEVDLLKCHLFSFKYNKQHNYSLHLKKSYNYCSSIFKNIDLSGPTKKVLKLLSWVNNPTWVKENSNIV